MSRSVRRCFCACVAFLVLPLLLATSVQAQQGQQGQQAANEQAARPADLRAARRDPATSAAPEEGDPQRLYAIRPVPDRRGALVPLYVSYASLQVLNAHSVFPALDGHGRQANPLITEFTRNRAGFIAMKAGVAAGTIYLTEKLRQRNRVAAVVVMVGLNSALAAITAHNYRVTGRWR